ncbi:MAG TPA: VWA domain-containing protein, partial [Candidatus Ozemobacteraceae bacterium]|nr:VWA domain-containing protein [Candidatus Ozemobacteraceae bacterium]
LGFKLSEEEAAIRYYREMAAPHLIPFPTREQPKAADPLPEGLEVWDIGSPLDEVDWQGSTMLNPAIIPGFTTMRRVMGTSEGELPEKLPIDLDLYVDSSGSMPDPRHQISYLTLAGTIIALSALRVGARVQATLWSGKREFLKTDGFVRDGTEIMKVLVGFFGGATAFPVHILRDTYLDRKPNDRKVHIMVISDDGVDTMLDNDEKGNSGAVIAAEALKKGGAGGSLVLNLYGGTIRNPKIKKLGEQGWNLYPISDWPSLTQFARDFSRAVYAAESGSKLLKR